jgi:hypothetical protein
MSASTGRARVRLQKIGLWGEATRKSQCGTDANRWGKRSGGWGEGLGAADGAARGGGPDDGCGKQLQS